ncbi:expressed unknown protein [Seminavis robusta]|uniref:Uncharacterized protein n=1 Tax=Seminavis robusta TaxID=568900 RepID=A0A9N8HPP6_9STRA|nr:expressed unknown protein [Seminavis robusta]|eukprot:Sro1196_g251480.1 n/a (448) ;mRNA; f:17369-18712
MGGNDQLDRQLAMSILMNGGASASEAVKMARLQQQHQLQQNHHQQQQAASQAAGQPPSQHQQQQFLQAMAPGAPGAPYPPDMLRLQRDLLNREIAARTTLPTWTSTDTPYFLRAAALNAPQHPPLSSLLTQQVQAHSAGFPSLAPMPAPVPAAFRTSPPSSPTIKPDPDAAGLAPAIELARKRGSIGASSQHSNGSDTPQNHKKPRLTAAFNPASPSAAAASMHLRHSLVASSAPHMVMPPMHTTGHGGARGSKAKLRDDFWGKVGKNSSHIHLVNIVLGRLLHQQVKSNIKRGGNKVLSNDLIQQILDTKLYGKYAVQDFFASSNKASETVRNTWTRLNFASDDIRKGLSRYKEQTWQAIERCSYDEKDLTEEDRKEMEDALKTFVQTGRFVSALDVALKGIITEQFMGVLMQLRLEWNSICLNCRPGEHDSVVAAFLRKYGMNGK